VIAPPTDLTVPEPGSTTARTVLSRAIGRLPADLRDVLRRPIHDPALRRDVTALSKAISAMPDRSSALASVLRRANVGSLLRCARNEPSDALIAELVATIAVELTVLGALTTPLQLEHPPARVVSLAGRFAIDRPTVISAATLPPRSESFFDVEGDIVLALEDDNPLSMMEAHPRKSGNRIDLGQRPASEWCASLRDSLDRIARYVPDLRREIDLYVQQFVPVGFDAEAHLSASYREAIGTIYLTLHPQPMTMTEAVIHEFSHNKINALFEIDDVLHNAYAPLFASPVRPDPRPLHGVLLAVHAFVPVARLYEAMIEAGDPLTHHPSFAARFAGIVAGNHEGTTVLLAHADPTPVGRAVLDELERWDRHFASVSPRSADIAARTPSTRPGGGAST
jgi:HEXXH motif-containing protein